MSDITVKIVTFDAELGACVSEVIIDSDVCEDHGETHAVTQDLAKLGLPDATFMLETDAVEAALSILMGCSLTDEQRVRLLSLTTKATATSIKQWVSKAYGEEEAAHPSWNIKALAKHLTGEA